MQALCRIFTVTVTMSLLCFVVDNSFIVPNQYDNACMSEEIRSLNQEIILMYDVTKLKADILLFY